MQGTTFATSRYRALPRRVLLGLLPTLLLLAASCGKAPENGQPHRPETGSVKQVVESTSPDRSEASPPALDAPLSNAAAPEPLFTVLLDEKAEFVAKWYICGPFAKLGSPAVERRWASPDAAAPASTQSLLTESYDTKEGASGWVLTPIESTEMLSKDPATGEPRPLKTTIIDFLKAYPDSATASSAYALAFVESPSDLIRNLLVGSDDGITIWLNGEKIHDNQTTRPIVPDEDLVLARFHTGRNVLLVEVTNAAGYWGFMLRFSPTGGGLPSISLPAFELPMK